MPNQRPKMFGGSISAVMAVEDEIPSVALLAELADRLADRFADVELIIVANGVTDRGAIALHEVIETIADATVLFLPHRTDHDVARLIGMENAVGDSILVATPTEAEVRNLPRLLADIDPGTEIVLAATRTYPAHRHLAKRLYYRFYGRLNGAELEVIPSPLRLYTRAAGLHLITSFSGEMLLKSRVVPGGFPTQIVPSDLEIAERPRRGFSASVGKALTATISASALPLRIVSLSALLMAVLAVIYSAYIVGIYLFESDVQPGWTTLSLQLSGWMLFTAVMFGLLSEYILQLYAASSPRRRHVIAREIRSRHSRRTNRLNVVDESGAYHLGAPGLSPTAAADPVARTARP